VIEKAMKIEAVKGGICAVKGVRAYGIKEGSKGLAIIEGKGNAAGVFTSNKLKAAPLLFTKKQLEHGTLSAVIANSGCANSFTGETGLKNAEKMAELGASSLGVAKEEVAVLSTGPIGVHLDMDLIERQLSEVVKGLTADKEGSTKAAKAIMTTDTFHKEYALRLETDDGKSVVIGGIAKGSGMIFPRMATMLSLIYTDAALPEETLTECLKDAVDHSFNMIVVDGDMSTNDTVLLVSTGMSSGLKEEDFKAGLTVVCTELAKLIAKDGEGATKFIEVQVKGAASDVDARNVAREILRSPLVKSALFGERLDLTCGRIIAAIGNSAREVNPSGISITLRNEQGEEVVAVNKGDFEDLRGVVRNILKTKKLFIGVYMGMNEEAEATAWGCDLSYDYVTINAA
jgi:glutamate N-acetyltransferase/amino-acid N-acetyltransferase